MQRKLSRRIVYASIRYRRWSHFSYSSVQSNIFGSREFTKRANGRAGDFTVADIESEKFSRAHPDPGADHSAIERTIGRASSASEA